MSNEGTFKRKGMPIREPRASVFGNTHYVSKNGSDSRDGKTPDHAHLTVTEAVRVAGLDGLDATIIIGRGQYKEAAAIALTSDHHGLRLFADGLGPNKALTRTEIRQHGNEEVPCITVEGAHNVEIAGFRLTPYTAQTGIGIAVAQTANTYGTYIHDNYFYAVQQSYMCTHLKIGLEDNYNADSTVVDNNYFLAGGMHGAEATTMTHEHRCGTFSTISNNIYICYGNTTKSITIYCSDEGTDTVERLSILDNRFFAFEGGGILAIDTGNTTDGHVWIDGNSFTGFTANDNCFGWTADNAGINYRQGAAITATS